MLWERFASYKGTLYNMANLYKKQSKVRSAEEMYRKAAAVYGASYGIDHSETLDALQQADALGTSVHQWWCFVAPASPFKGRKSEEDKRATTNVQNLVNLKGPWWRPLSKNLQKTQKQPKTTLLIIFFCWYKMFSSHFIGKTFSPTKQCK